MNRKHFMWRMIAFSCIVAIWAAASWAIWSEVAFRPGLFAVPIGILSWPAHEACLAISGQGMGANAKCPATAWSFLVFLAQAAVTWAPTAPSMVSKRNRWVLMLLQGAVFLLLFAGFWRYGNG